MACRNIIHSCIALNKVPWDAMVGPGLCAGADVSTIALLYGII